MSTDAAKRRQIRQQIRQQMRERRASLDSERQTRAAEAVLAKLEKIEMLRTAAAVAGYRGVRGEVNIDEILSRLIARGATVTVPRVVGDHLEFVEWLPAAASTRGAFGIPEPVGSEALDLRAHDAVLAPLTAFDRTGARIGQGGGFYDRSLGRLGDERPALIGIAYAFQEVEQIPVEPWDIPLDAVVTDTRVTVFRSGTL
ncbi:MAG: 5-formyltetrahydrofolate cyclo-ligase [Acidimicrobiaceae bacterium]|nr:5-formyltetrahydrofolate cyclo-ligase [Acidimicrobiia bacterium]MCY4495194.1 5-formyltetrahydrofolate cyclo-ligase [Acidimicrobiaceae bacterium]